MLFSVGFGLNAFQTVGSLFNILGEVRSLANIIWRYFVDWQNLIHNQKWKLFDGAVFWSGRSLD
jgi:hypothetical protein